VRRICLMMHFAIDTGKVWFDWESRRLLIFGPNTSVVKQMWPPTELYIVSEGKTVRKSWVVQISGLYKLEDGVFRRDAGYDTCCRICAQYFDSDILFIWCSGIAVLK
jgi:hypothetical protein